MFKLCYQLSDCLAKPMNINLIDNVECLNSNSGGITQLKSAQSHLNFTRIKDFSSSVSNLTG